MTTRREFLQAAALGGAALAAAGSAPLAEQRSLEDAYGFGRSELVSTLPTRNELAAPASVLSVSPPVAPNGEVVASMETLNTVATASAYCVNAQIPSKWPEPESTGSVQEIGP